MTTTERQDWEQLPNESGEAFHAFEVYLQLGAGRTLGKTTRALAEAKSASKPGANRGQTGGKPGPTDFVASFDKSVRIWAKKFRWEERAAAHDHHLAAARDHARVKVVETREMQRARRVERVEQETLVAAEQLKLKAFQMLQGPLETVTRETRTEAPDGHTTIIHQTVEPARWSIRDAATMLRLARDLEDAVFFPDRNRQQPAVVLTPTERSERLGAQRRLDDWRADMTRHMLTMPTSPPGATPPPHEGNGHADRGGERQEDGRRPGR